jgi:hypothetical protein
MPSNVFSQEKGGVRVPVDQIAQRWTTILLLFAVLFPAVVSFGVLHRQALTVPYQDDYNAILAFAIGYHQLPDARAKLLDIAAAQHNEYKLGFEHAVVASELELTQRLNFGFLTACGNCFLLAIGCLLWWTYAGDGDLRLRLLTFLPVSLLFFSITYWENLNWAMTDLQNIPVVFFSLLAIYLMVPTQSSGATPSRMAAACIAAALAAFTSANGFLLGPVGLLFLLPRRAYARSLAWCASFVVPLAAYLYHYAPQPHELSRFSYLKRPLFFLGFLGGAIPFRWVAVALGIAVFAVILLAAYARFDRTNPVASYFVIWLVATACLAAWVRGGSAFTVASRYSIYSVLLLISCYSFLAHYLPSRKSAFNRPRFYQISLVVAFGIWLIGNASAYKNLGARRQMVLTGVELYRAAPGRNSPMIDPQVERLFPSEKVFEQVTLTKAIQEGIYTLPPKQEIRPILESGGVWQK